MISTIYEGRSVRRSCYLSKSNSGENEESIIQNALLAASAVESISQQMTSPEKINSSDENEDFTILVEIVATTIPKKPRHEASNSLTPQARGMHCTANWIGPVNPSGRKRRENFFHRTKTLKLNSDSDTSVDATPDINTVGKFNNLEEHIFTVEDSSLFLFKTTMKQLVNASAHDDRMSNGGLKFDLYEKPINILTTSVGNALSDIIRHEKEAIAMTQRDSSVSSLLGGSYRLIGTVYLSPQDILSSCDGSRIEFGMVNKLALTRQNGQKPSQTARKVPGARLVLRMRKATTTDIAFMKLLHRKLKFGGDDFALLKDLTEGEEGGDDEDILPVQLLTEIDEKLIAAQTSFECIGHVANATHESIRYLISDDTEKKHHVRPYPDPSRKKETTMLTKSQLREECYKPSTKWVHAGSGSLGTVFIEFLKCRDLPNTDTGGAVGNLTDAFISAIYGDVLVQTDVIDDCLSPMWMPWSTRAFKFQMSHPSMPIMIAVTDYDVGPLEHETIGRVAIQLNKFTPGILYTLAYDLHESSNLLEFGDSVGKITVRIRIEYDEHKMLMASLKPPGQSWVTSKRKKTHQVAKYCTEGPHDEDTFELQLFWSHIDEIWGKKRMLSYMISDMFYSLIFWRDQVQGLPLHSAVVFYLSVNVVEKPHLLPSYILFLSGWLMLASLMQRNNHPNPWKRGHSLLHYWNILVHGESLDDSPKEIKPMEGYKESVKYEKRWTDRMNEDNRQYARQADLYARLQEVEDDSNIRTKSKSKLKGALIDQILAPKLLYYQQWLSSICLKIRLVRNVFNWSESEIAFFVTLALFGSSFIALFIPWAFLLRWTSRVVAWVFLGPWMRVVDALLHGSNDETRRKHEKAKASKQIVQSFMQQHKLARIQRESALKMKAFRKLLFGRYNTRVPERGYLSRHEDIPLPESLAEHLSDEFIRDTSNSSAFYIPGQNLSGGELIPRIGIDNSQYLADIQEEKKLLESQYNSLADSRRCGFLITQHDEESETTQQFELVRSDNDVICLHSPDLLESFIERSTSTTPLTEIRSTENVAQKAIRIDLKSKLLSASLSMSIKMNEPGNTNYAHSDISSVTHTLDDVSNWAQAAIEEEQEPIDEGVEIVPVMSGDEFDRMGEESINSGDETSTVFRYVKNKSE
mmetsp:Transcript_6803/g.9990  ORF Transcript_6803/g.9990 Transcript_6803/m.9990 type:complete len:1147 (-) Transcript_6803:2430-5870(-)